jgi:hypothetical protein
MVLFVRLKNATFLNISVEIPFRAQASVQGGEEPISVAQRTSLYPPF